MSGLRDRPLKKASSRSRDSSISDLDEEKPIEVTVDKCKIAPLQHRSNKAANNTGTRHMNARVYQKVDSYLRYCCRPSKFGELSDKHYADPCTLFSLSSKLVLLLSRFLLRVQHAHATLIYLLRRRINHALLPWYGILWRRRGPSLPGPSHAISLRLQHFSHSRYRSDLDTPGIG